MLRDQGFTFGTFAGVCGTEFTPFAGSMRRYDPNKTEAALAALHEDRPFVVRVYGVYHGKGVVGHATPPDFVRFAGGRRAIEYVLAYRSQDGDVVDWCGVIERELATFGSSIAAVQIGEEANNPDPDTGGDGASPNVLEAIVEGVRVARRAIASSGRRIAVGVNAAPSFDPADRFWSELVERGGEELCASLDYVGIDFFPDVFRPLPTATFRDAVVGVLTHFRNTLVSAGIAPTTPLRVTENGWPTGPKRPAERQAEVLEQVVRAVHAERRRLNVTHYEYFGLRDADNADDAVLGEWGLVRADYTPKPAFDVYRRLIAELTTPLQAV